MNLHGNKSDGQIQADVMSELRADSRVQAAAVGVAVEAGVVTLTGTVDSWSFRQAAREAAHRVEGVLDVANDIVVRVPGSLRRTDADIARAVRQALEWDTRVPHDRIRSTVTNGDVTLEGSLEYWSQREDAEDAVRNLAGVSGVNNVLSVDAPRVASEDVHGAIARALERRAQREGQRIEVTVVDGRVVLSGSVQSWAERTAILGSVGALTGVRGVEDRLRVEPAR